MREATTTDGCRVGEEIDKVIEATRAECRKEGDPKAFGHLEAHIEQGPILEREKLRIGVVEGIQGVARVKISIDGEAAHAGTTPHQLRRDAVVSMTRIIQALVPLTQDADDILRLTFGRIEVEANVPNTVPEKAAITIDLRHPDASEIERVIKRMEEVAEEFASPCTARVEKISNVDPVEIRTSGYQHDRGGCSGAR